MRTKLTEEQRTERRALRSLRRSKVETAREDLKTWRREAAAKAHKRNEKWRKKFMGRKDRGVHRVPKKLRNLAGAYEVEQGELGTYKGYQANYADRRRAGQRGHTLRRELDPKRKRFLPGAQARRVERNRQAWSK